MSAPALLMMDVQNAIVQRVADDDDLLARTARAIAAARKLFPRQADVVDVAAWAAELRG